jgi:hypothetical protein
MFKQFGFYFPDAQYLADPEGLLKYLVSRMHRLGCSWQEAAAGWEGSAVLRSCAPSCQPARACLADPCFPGRLGARPCCQGAKLQYGHVPLYESGDNPNAKQFASLHAVQVGCVACASAVCCRTSAPALQGFPPHCPPRLPDSCAPFSHASPRSFLPPFLTIPPRCCVPQPCSCRILSRSCSLFLSASSPPPSPRCTAPYG